MLRHPALPGSYQLELHEERSSRSKFLTLVREFHMARPP